MKNSERIIVALDVPDAVDALLLVEQLSTRFKWFKIGLELIVSQQAETVIEGIRENGANVFLDPKLNDIPNTVGRTVARIADRIDMINLHALCGIEAMKAAVENAGGAKVLAVTILTSLNGYDLINLGFSSQTCTADELVQNRVKHLANLAMNAGCHGIVCSPKDLPALGNFDLLRVTPGVRPSWASQDDQKRVMTPLEAFEAGADYLVIGRPLTQPKGMTVIEAADRLVEEIEVPSQD